jgi:hypothetical protein
MASRDDRDEPKSGKAGKRAERDQRLAEALRANLNRRKAQERARKPPEDTKNPRESG